MTSTVRLRRLVATAAIGAGLIGSAVAAATPAAAQVYGPYGGGYSGGYVGGYAGGYAGGYGVTYGAPVMDVNGVLRLPAFQVPVSGPLGWRYTLQGYWENGAGTNAVRATELWLLPNGGILLNDGCVGFTGRWWNAPGVTLQAWMTSWCGAIDHQANAIGRALQGPIRTSYDGTTLYVQGGSFTLQFVRTQSFVPSTPPAIFLVHPAPQVAYWGNWSALPYGQMPWGNTWNGPVRVTNWAPIAAQPGHHDGSWVLSSTTVPYMGSAVGQFRLNLAGNGTWTARPMCNWYSGAYTNYTGTELTVTSWAWYAAGCSYLENSFDKGVIAELRTAYYATSDATTLNVTTQNGVMVFTRAG